MDMAHYRKWRGKEVTLAVGRNMAKVLGKFALVAEGFSKKELKKGHGVKTGTLRRSIHTAQPGYDWTGDNVEPENNTPELGGELTEGKIEGQRITVQLGSGLVYSLPVHQGHDGFEGYHFLTNGIEKANDEMPGILKEYEMKE